MEFTITVFENLDEPDWSIERFTALNDFYRIEVSGDDEGRVLNEAKGTVLSAVALRHIVPDEIRFKVEKRKRSREAEGARLENGRTP